MELIACFAVISLEQFSCLARKLKTAVDVGNPFAIIVLNQNVDCRNWNQRNTVCVTFVIQSLPTTT